MTRNFFKHVNAPIIMMGLSSLALGGLSGCNGAGEPVAQAAPSATAKSEAKPEGKSDEAASGLKAPTGERTERAYKTDVLLFTGSGAWGTEVSALEELFKEKGVKYESVGSGELEAMTTEQLADFGTIVWPGGSGGTQANSISEEARVRIRKAVQEIGLNWVGFCAGSFVAVAPTPADGGAPGYGLGIVDAPELEYYSREDYYQKNGGTDIEMAMHTFADGTERDILWYGGPATPEVPGGVVARYPDGAAAISQIQSGKGFVMLSGSHPVVPQSLRDQYNLDDKDGLDVDVAWMLIQAAMKQEPLKAFE